MASDPDPTELLPVVGNDVVDLADPRCAGKHRDARFLKRVFAAPERAAIEGSGEPERALWLHWAAKEAAYKVVSKGPDGPPPFNHASFEVEVAEGGLGRVRYGSLVVPFRVVLGGERLHVVALDPRVPGWPDDTTDPRLHTGLAPAVLASAREAQPPLDEILRERFSDLERPAVHSAAAARVRLEARADLARLLDVGEERLQIVCRGGAPGRTPPVALLDGRRAPADVSLSHHGRWVGWALLVVGQA